MNNYYELIYLTQELKETLIGYSFEYAITPHKDVLECYLADETHGNRLVFSARADETALFLDSYRPPKKRNVVEFFESVKGQQVKGVELAKDDRLIYVHFDSGWSLQFKMFSGRPNAFLIDRNRQIIMDAFKNTDNHVGEESLQPYQPEREEWPNPEAKPKNQVQRLNPLLPRNLIPRLIKEHRVDQMSPEEVKEFVEDLTNQLLQNPHPRVLETGEIALWSEDILPVPTEKTFDSVNETILYAYRNMVHERRLSQKKEKVIEDLDRNERKLEDHMEQLQQMDERLEQADDYEKKGHILMAHAHKEVSGGTTEIELPDPYQEDHHITIPLKENMSLADNAKRYYEKAKDARKSYESAQKRIKRVRRDLELTRKLVGELDKIDRLPELDKWMKSHKDDLDKIGIGQEPDQQYRSPFRKTKVGKYEVWIGKSAKSNDELLSTAHKEDVWFHARGVAGAHAIIRMGNRKDYPPEQIILQAASYAAYYSKLSGADTVPVMYTKRKYLGKPKGGAPGQVTVKFEDVVMVPPHKPEQQ